jgi:hypothetical protein
MMSPAIDNPASCEIHAVVHFFMLETSAAEILRELCVVYSQNVMSEMCGQTDVHDEE